MRRIDIVLFVSTITCLSLSWCNYAGVPVAVASLSPPPPPESAVLVMSRQSPFYSSSLASASAPASQLRGKHLFNEELPVLLLVEPEKPLDVDPSLQVPANNTGRHEHDEHEPCHEIHNSFQRIKRQNRQKTLFTCLLAASAGFGDVRSHRTYGCFVNMCTGNTIRVAVALAESITSISSSSSSSFRKLRDAVVPAAVVAGYVAGVALARTSKHAIVGRIEQQQQQQTTITTGSILDNVSAASTDNTLLVHRVVRKLFLPFHVASKSLTSAVVVAVTPLIVLLFLLADLLTFAISSPPTTTAGGKAASWHAVAAVVTQACAYGLVHMAASDAVGGTVLFAVTGHYAGISRNCVDYCHSSWPIKNLTMTTTTTTASLPPPVVEPTTASTAQQQLLGHAQMVGSFVAGIFAGVFVLDRIVPLLVAAAATGSNYGDWPLLAVFPVHTLTGLFYAALFLWYGGQSVSP